MDLNTALKTILEYDYAQAIIDQCETEEDIFVTVKLANDKIRVSFKVDFNMTFAGDNGDYWTPPTYDLVAFNVYGIDDFLIEGLKDDLTDHEYDLLYKLTEDKISETVTGDLL